MEEMKNNIKTKLIAKHGIYTGTGSSMSLDLGFDTSKLIAWFCLSSYNSNYSSPSVSFIYLGQTNYYNWGNTAATKITKSGTSILIEETYSATITDAATFQWLALYTE